MATKKKSKSLLPGLPAKKQFRKMSKRYQEYNWSTNRGRINMTAVHLYTKAADIERAAKRLADELREMAERLDPGHLKRLNKRVDKIRAQ